MEYSRDRYVPSSSIEDIDASVLRQRSALQRLLPPANHFSAHETFDIGRNEGMPVNREYEDKGTFIFTEGQLHDVIVDIAQSRERQFLKSCPVAEEVTNSVIGVF